VSSSRETHFTPDGVSICCGPVNYKRATTPWLEHRLEPLVNEKLVRSQQFLKQTHGVVPLQF